MSLNPILRTAIGHFRSGHLDTEEEVKAAVILPVLLALGWDLADRSIRPEYRAGSGRVDYALLCHGRPQVFIEAKRRGALDVRAEEQLFGYASNAGIPLLVLTDGCLWDFYLSMADGPPTERRFRRLELHDANGIPAYSEILETCLSNRRVASGDARRNAEDCLQKARERTRARAAIPDAWNALLTEPDEFLCDLLAERVHDQTGAKPERADVEDFLRNLRPVPGRSPAPAGKNPRGKTGSASIPGIADVAGIHWEAAAEPSPQPSRSKSARGGEFQAIVYDLMRAVLETHPEILDEEAILYLENTKRPFGTKLSYPLILKTSESRYFGGYSRYKEDKFAGRWHVCTEWNKPHGHNARALSKWVESLTARTDSPEARDCLENILSRLSSWEKDCTS